MKRFNYRLFIYKQPTESENFLGDLSYKKCNGNFQKCSNPHQVWFCFTKLLSTWKPYQKFPQIFLHERFSTFLAQIIKDYNFKFWFCDSMKKWESETEKVLAPPLYSTIACTYPKLIPNTQKLSKKLRVKNTAVHHFEELSACNLNERIWSTFI